MEIGKDPSLPAMLSSSSAIVAKVPSVLLTSPIQSVPMPKRERKAKEGGEDVCRYELLLI